MTEETEAETNVVDGTTEVDETTIVDSETTGADGTTETEGVNSVEHSTTTIGRVLSATIPILPSETFAIDAKHHAQAVAEDIEGSTTTEADGTTTVDSETTVADGTTTVDSETTVVGGTTTVDSETTEAGGTTETVDANNEGRSTTTIGHARSATIPISHSETSATGVKNHGPAVAVVAGDATTTEDRPPDINRGTTDGVATAVVSDVDDLSKVVAEAGHSNDGTQTFNPGEREESAQVTLTISRLEISGRHESLSARTTERTCGHEC